MKKSLLILVFLFGLFVDQATADPPDTRQETTFEISQEIEADYFLPIIVYDCYPVETIISPAHLSSKRICKNVFIEDLTRLDIGETIKQETSYIYLYKAKAKEFAYSILYRTVVPDS